MTQTKRINLIYPHQLFPLSKTDALSSDALNVLIEEPLFFTQFRFHKKKLMLHRASMKAYEKYLNDNDYKTAYFEAKDFEKTQDVFREISKKYAPTEIHVAEPDDFLLKKRVEQWASNNDIDLVVHESPLFLTPDKELKDFFEGKENVLMAEFYKNQRTRMNVLVDDDGKPEGGKWSFDDENREALPKNETVPELPPENRSEYVGEARAYVEKHFSENYGSSENFFYPVTRGQAREWFSEFLENRFRKFGVYEDAFQSEGDSFLYHSVLTPFLNVGLMTPDEVVDETLSFSKKHDVPLNALEGFLRQIIGWREFMHGIYRYHGARIREKNFFAADRKLPEAFWTAETDFLPVNRVIEKTLETGYAHHIERLMVMSNIFTLAEIEPHDAYGWFMEMFIDAYDWVMVPNVYSMGIFADGGFMATKPYVSSSNYLSKMSDWKRKKDDEEHWSFAWDALYWRFLSKNRDFFTSNPRLARVTSHLDKMSDEKWQAYENTAQAMLSEIAKGKAHFSKKDEKQFRKSS